MVRIQDPPTGPYAAGKTSAAFFAQIMDLSAGRMVHPDEDPVYLKDKYFPEMSFWSCFAEMG